MKKITKIIIVLLIIIIGTIFIYNTNKKLVLPDNYKLWKENKKIVFGKQIKTDSFIMIDKDIKKISYNKDYIAIMLEKNKQIKYYFIDIKKNSYIDNIDENQLKEKMKQTKFKKMKWYNLSKFM